MIFGAIQLKTGCGQCGQPVILNGPTLCVLCNACQTEMKLDPRAWYSMLEYLPAGLRKLKREKGSDSHIWGSVEVHLQEIRTDPLCPSCDERFTDPYARVAAGTTGWTCDSCGKVTPACKPPDWLAWALPEIAFLINVDDVTPDGKSETKAMKPVLFTCPSCSGNLKIDGKDRMIECNFCQSSVYLPDDLWLRLHPVKKVRTWYVAIAEESDDAELKQRMLNRDLLLAAYQEHEDRAANAIEKGADPRAADHEERSALFYAAATDCRKLVRILLAQDVDVDRSDDFGTTPLNIASCNGNIRIVKYLLKAGAEVNQQNKVGVTALYGAAKSGHTEIVRRLLAAGADASIPNKDGVTPLQRAKEARNRGVVALLENT